jgi:hypothetical protein
VVKNIETRVKSQENREKRIEQREIWGGERKIGEGFKSDFCPQISTRSAGNKKMCFRYIYVFKNDQH